MELGECSHNSYWKSVYDNCMACRAENAEKETADLRTRLAACEKEALSVGAVSVAQLADWYVTVSNDCVELKKNLAACEAERDGFRELARSQMESCARHCAEQAQAEARVQALEEELRAALNVNAKDTPFEHLWRTYCELRSLLQQLEQEQARLRQENEALRQRPARFPL